MARADIDRTGWFRLCCLGERGWSFEIGKINRSGWDVAEAKAPAHDFWVVEVERVWYRHIHDGCYMLLPSHIDIVQDRIAIEMLESFHRFQDKCSLMPSAPYSSYQNWTASPRTSSPWQVWVYQQLRLSVLPGSSIKGSVVLNSISVASILLQLSAARGISIT